MLTPMAWVLDLDGVVYLGDKPIPGVADAVARLRGAGERVLFATNASAVELATLEDKLARFGIPAQGDVVSSALAGASLLNEGERVLTCGGPGPADAARRRGNEVVTARDEAQRSNHGGPDVDAVLVGGFGGDFCYDELRVTVQAVLRGARLIGTNSDPVYPTPQGPFPAGGALVAAIAYAAGVDPEVAGKPHAPMADLIHSLVDGEDGKSSADGGAPSPTGRNLMVGDRPESDGVFARTLGYDFGLVFSGMTAESDLPVDPVPVHTAADLPALVDDFLSR
jgi:HAD superfamily hydrolase (TIGR01450 family)